MGPLASQKMLLHKALDITKNEAGNSNKCQENSPVEFPEPLANPSREYPSWCRARPTKSASFKASPFWGAASLRRSRIPFSKFSNFRFRHLGSATPPPTESKGQRPSRREPGRRPTARETLQTLTNCGVTTIFRVFKVLPQDKWGGEPACLRSEASPSTGQHSRG